jgi:hypothetical protein
MDICGFRVGSRDRPMNDAEINEKFLGQAAGQCRLVSLGFFQGSTRSAICSTTARNGC